MDATSRLSIRVKSTEQGRPHFSDAGPIMGDCGFAATLVSETPVGTIHEEVEFRYRFDEITQERIRWLVEDFGSFTHDPGPALAALAAQTCDEVGSDLFERVFGSRAGQRIWKRHERTIDETIVEITVFDDISSAVPWDFIRLPISNLPLALAARCLSFAPPPESSTSDGKPQPLLARWGEALKARLFSKRDDITVESSHEQRNLRVLLLISRPDGPQDVPFLSVSSGILSSAGTQRQFGLDVKVVRPPTFDQLQAELMAAVRVGRPYDIVHCDCHGAYLDPNRLGESRGRAFRGFLVFEAPTMERSGQLVGGVALGRLLEAAKVPVLVVNACRSALEQPVPKPRESPFETPLSVRYGSFAREAVRCGIDAVVAMRYNVDVPTASAFIGHLYRNLASGIRVEEATSNARRAVWAPRRDVGGVYVPRWSVPLLVCGGFGDSRTNHNARSPEDPSEPHLSPSDYVIAHRTFCELERHLTHARAVLLHGPIGSGKSSAAHEFGRWYTATGGARCLVHVDLSKMPNCAAFESLLHEKLALASKQPQDGVPQALVVIDHLEVISGFPSQEDAIWPSSDGARLVRLLDERFNAGDLLLLTSVRENDELARKSFSRVECKPLSRAESEELCVSRMGSNGPSQPLSEILKVSRGNPLATLAIVSADNHSGAASDNYRALNSTVSARISEALRDLARYCSEHGCTDILAAISEFSGGVNLASLGLLRIIAKHGLRQMEALSAQGQSPDSFYRETPLDEIKGFVDRCTELGLLLGRISELTWRFHPFLIAFSKGYRDANLAGLPPQALADYQLAFVQAIAAFCTSVEEMTQDRHEYAARELYVNRKTIMAALDASLSKGWHQPVFGLLTGLEKLYVPLGAHDKLGREYARVLPYYLDTDTWESRPGTEAFWTAAAPLQIFLYREAHDPRAEQLLRRLVEKSRQTLAAHTDAETDYMRRVKARSLASVLFELGEVLRVLDNPACVGAFRESYEIFLANDSNGRAATAVRAAGDAYLNLQPIRNLEYAERCYARAAELLPDSDFHRKAKLTVTQAVAAWRRAQEEGISIWAGEKTLARYHRIEKLFKEALRLYPESSISGRAQTHNDLGMFYREGGHISDALTHLSEALKLFVSLKDMRSVALVQDNLALLEKSNGRLPEALEYARSARKSYQIVGDSDSVQRMEKAVVALTRELNTIRD